MERYFIFLGRKNQYCENDYTKGNLQIQCDPYQIINVTFHITKKAIFKIWMETQKTLNSQSNLEKEKQSWRNQAPWLQIILQCCRNQNSMVLAQNWIYGSKEQDRNHRNKPTYLWSIQLQQGWEDYTMEKTENYMWKNEIRTFSNTIHKSKLKCKYKTRYYKMQDQIS